MAAESTAGSNPDPTTSSTLTPDVREIPGDLGVDGKNLSCPGALRVAGSICGGVTVEAGGAISVDGNIEAATVNSGSALTVKGNIVGRGRTHCTSRSNTSFRSAIAATVECQGDVVCEVELANSRVTCAGSLHCHAGHIYGGHVTANGGVWCTTLGSPGGGVAATLIEVGIDESVRKLAEAHAATIDANLKRSHKIRSQVGPLMSQLRSLTAKQKETATELLYEASELEEQTAQLVAQINARIAESSGRSVREVNVSGTIHAGVTIRFAGAQMTTERAIKGPVKVVCEGKGDATKVLLIEPNKPEPTIAKFSLHADANLVALGHALAAAKAYTANQPRAKAA